MSELSEPAKLKKSWTYYTNGIDALRGLFLVPSFALYEIQPIFEHSMLYPIDKITT